MRRRQRFRRRSAYPAAAPRIDRTDDAISFDAERIRPAKDPLLDPPPVSDRRNAHLGLRDAYPGRTPIVASFLTIIPPVYSVYIVRCADASLYTGYAKDVDERVEVHNAGKGAKYTASRRPVTLVYRETCASLSEALKRELQIKGCSRTEKEALIAQRGTEAPG